MHLHPSRPWTLFFPEDLFHHQTLRWLARLGQLLNEIILVQRKMDAGSFFFVFFKRYPQKCFCCQDIQNNALSMSHDDTMEFIISWQYNSIQLFHKIPIYNQCHFKMLYKIKLFIIYFGFFILTVL